MVFKQTPANDILVSLRCGPTSWLLVKKMFYYFANKLNKANEHGKHLDVSIAFVGMLTTLLYLDSQGSTAVGFKCC